MHQHPDCVEVHCGVCARDPHYTATTEMRRVDLFPNWSLKPRT